MPRPTRKLSIPFFPTRTNSLEQIRTYFLSRRSSCSSLVREFSPWTSLRSGSSGKLPREIRLPLIELRRIESGVGHRESSSRGAALQGGSYCSSDIRDSCNWDRMDYGYSWSGWKLSLAP